MYGLFQLYTYNARMKHSILYAIAIILLVSGACSTTGPYARKLKDGAAYTGGGPDLQFTFQDAKAEELADLKQDFEFETVAGDGTGQEQIINLLHWAVNLVPWDGSAPWPEGVLSTRAILDHVKQTGGGVNCRMKAIILQEACLAMGFPARIVGCIPLDPEDRDSHVITAVWSQGAEKWLWMDPSFNAYVTDENGILQSISEVRRGLIEGREFFLNPEAEIRGKPLDADWYFGYYMTKNLYAFISPLHAAYAYEGSPGLREWVMLVPATDYPAEEDRRMVDYPFRESENRRYTISNPGVFWAAPEER